MATPDNRRRQEIIELMDLLGLEEDTQILKAIPSEADDPDDSKMELFYALVQLISLLASSDHDQKCDILKDINLLNKQFKIEFASLEYYKNLCKG